MDIEEHWNEIHFFLSATQVFPFLALHRNPNNTGDPLENAGADDNIEQRFVVLFY